MLCFSYGSNMLQFRINDRLGDCERLGVAYLTGYTLRFNKKSKKDGSGKCNVSHTGDSGDGVWGALDCLTEEQFKKLDRIEGRGYCRLPVKVTFGKRKVEAEVYVAKSEYVSHDLRSTHCYKKVVLAGAQELGLPSDYIANYIESVCSKDE